MQNDILPPSNWGNTKKTNSKSAGSPKSRKLALDKSRERLVKTDAHEPERAAAEAYAAQPAKPRLHHWSGRRKVLTALLAVVLLTGAAGGGYLFLFHKKATPVVTIKQ